MPQTTNRQLVRDLNNTPVGQGTVHNAMLKISAATRDRAKKANEGEQLRLGKVTRVMDRHQRIADNAQNRVLQRLQKDLKELQAFQIVLRDQYNVNNFRTLKTPPPRMSDRRRKLETMFYNSGFSQKTMQPEISRQLKKSDPERLRRKLKTHLLETSRQEVVRLVVRNSQVSSSLLTSSDSCVTACDEKDLADKDDDDSREPPKKPPSVSIDASIPASMD
ncbi:hypothetical protein ACOMHN_020695 [Nucella lapillus]